MADIKDGCYIYLHEESEYRNCSYCHQPDFKEHESDCEWVLEFSINVKAIELLKGIVDNPHYWDGFVSYSCRLCDSDINSEHEKDCLYVHISNFIKEL